MPKPNLNFLKALSLFLLLTLGWNASGQTNSAKAASEKKQFRAGAATSNITPKLGVSIVGNFHDAIAKHIHDELHARCLVLDDGQTRIAIVVCDSCLVPREVFDEAKRLIHEQTGLPLDRILIASTHTHSGAAAASLYQTEVAKEYLPFLTSRIVDGVRRAINNLAPAKIAWGVGSEPNQVFNRRWKMKPGAVLANPLGGTDQVKMNPPIANPNLLEPAGPTDPGISIISIQSPEGRPIALLANYSLHYVGGVPEGDISADYYGAFADRIQQLIGADHLDPEFVAIMSNGTSGDVNNINFRTPQKQQPPYGQIRFVANAVATEVHRVYQTLEYKDWVPLSMQQTEIKLGVRHPSDEDVIRARAILAKVHTRDMKSSQEIYARETMFIKDYPEQVPLIIQTIRIGDLGIAAIPCEVFAEIGLAIKEKSLFKPTFTIQLANGWSGYLPTPEQHKLGGYETWRARSSYLEVDASTKIFDTVMELLGKLK
ncbi:MAG: Neutral/alkaline non-lysosomal ceramidase [Pedosphaera sp.]|nr:Neutral/alkaline non-lysosomal ceramidase [Pedosphaera sp.]